MSDITVWIIPIAGIAAVLFAIWLARDVLSRDKGTKEMQEVGKTIQEGANAFVQRQYSTIALLAVVGTLIVAAIIAFVETKEVADTQIFGVELGIRTGFAFLVGAACSMVAGIIGMFVSVRANVPTAAAAQTSLVGAVQTAMRGGAVSGFLVVALSLLGVWGIFALFGGLQGGVNTAEAPFLIVGFGFGASFVALFAQLGGGIYTKAADVGADLVGKVEAGIPEDDPRNAAVIADLVGDNVGDCAGRGADLFESTAAENIGAMILGVAVYAIAVSSGWANPEAWILFPLVVRAFGLIATMIGDVFVRGREDEDPMRPQPGLLGDDPAVRRRPGHRHLPDDRNRPAAAPPTSVWVWSSRPASSASPPASPSSTSRSTTPPARGGPCKDIAEASKTGPATNIIAGIAVGFETTFATAIIIGIALLVTYWLGDQAGLVNAEGRNVGGVFGTAVATMGMLMTAAYILAMDTFGPITDNAGGITEMSGAGASARKITDTLDCRRQHHQGPHQGLRHRLGRPGRLPALPGLPRQGQPSCGRRCCPACAMSLRASWTPSTWPTRASSWRPSWRHARLPLQRPWPSAPWATLPPRSSRKCAASSARCPASWTTRQKPDYARARGHHHPRRPPPDDRRPVSWRS